MTDRRPRWVAVALAAIVAISLAEAAAGGYYLIIGDDPVTGVLTPLIVLSFSLAGAFIASQRWRNPLGWLFGAIGATFGIVIVTEAYATYAYALEGGPGRWGELASWYVGFGWIPPMDIGLMWVFMLFPNGRTLSRRWQRLAVVGVAAAIVTTAVFLALPPPSGLSREANVAYTPASWVFVGVIIGTVVVVAAVVSFVVRLHRSTGDERRQLRWLGFAAVLLMLTFAFNIVVDDWGSSPKVPFWSKLALSTFFAVLILVPVAAMIGILKYRLYDIDVVINKAFVYGVFAVFIAAVYVAIVVGVGSLAGGGDRPVLSLVATAIVAMAFQPLRARVQRVANRIVYGERATPYEVLSDLSERMSEAMSVDEVLPRMAEAAARAVGADVARVTVALPGGGERSVTWPDADAVLADGSVEVPVLHQGSPVGHIAVARASGERFAAAEVALLADLASQAGVALHNVALTSQLQARLEHLSRQADEVQRSRQRIVAARDAERRCMERDIHDGAQQQLVALSVKLGVAQQLLDRDADRATALLDDLGSDATEALEGLRDLARGLFPPLLAEQGLVAALDSHVQKHRLPAVVRASPEVAAQRFPEQIEVAAYFCCLEAIQNASKHAPGAALTIDVSLEGDALTFAVVDRGPGYDERTLVRGSGLQNMEDRLEALGGTLTIDSEPGAGTTVRGRIPLQLASAASHASTSASGPNDDLAM